MKREAKYGSVERPKISVSTTKFQNQTVTENVTRLFVATVLHREQNQPIDFFQLNESIHIKSNQIITRILRIYIYVFIYASYK
jgi:hypothetical protein